MVVPIALAVRKLQKAFFCPRGISKQLRHRRYGQESSFALQLADMRRSVHSFVWAEIERGKIAFKERAGKTPSTPTRACLSKVPARATPERENLAERANSTATSMRAKRPYQKIIHVCSTRSRPVIIRDKRQGRHSFLFVVLCTQLQLCDPL